MDTQRKWLKGDTHLHTTNSDGVLTLYQLTDKCKKKGLDWAIITDHNFSTVDTSYYDGSLLVIPGEELTGHSGHVNCWGIKMPFSAPYTLETFEDYTGYIQQAKDAGATISVNHPFDKSCGWKDKPLEGFPMDCVEVWNAPMHIDDMTNIQWWHNELVKGRRLAAVGGSDYHKDYVVTDLLAMPTTICYAKSNTAEDILEALRNGNSVITQGPDKTMIYLTCGDAFVGETVQWKPGIKVNVKVAKLKKGHRFVVYNNDRVLYEFRAEKYGNYKVDLTVKEKGFVRVEVLYEYGTVSKAVYKQVIKKIFPKDIGIPVPPYAYALTNPLFFE